MISAVLFLASIALANAAAQWQVFIDRAGEYRFRLLADNHEIVLASGEGYDESNSAIAAIDAIRTAEAAQWVLNESGLSFNVKAGNGLILARSEEYASASNAERGVADAKTAVAAAAKIEQGSLGKHVGRFVIFKDVAGEFRFRLLAANYRIVLVSEGYTTKQSAYVGIASVRQNAQDLNNFEAMDAVNNEFYFNLKAQNGEIVGTSETYKTTASRAIGINSVHWNAPLAEVEDRSWRVEWPAGNDPVETPVVIVAQSEGKFIVQYYDLQEDTIVTQTVGSKTAALARANDLKTELGAELRSSVDDKFRVARFEFFCASTGSGTFFFRLVAANSEIILKSEAYESKAALLNGRDSVLENAVKEMMFEDKDASNGKPYFNLKAKNGKIIGTASQQYSSKSARDAGKLAVTNAVKSILAIDDEDVTVDDQTIGSKLCKEVAPEARKDGDGETDAAGAATTTTLAATAAAVAIVVANF